MSCSPVAVPPSASHDRERRLADMACAARRFNRAKNSDARRSARVHVNGLYCPYRTANGVCVRGLCADEQRWRSNSEHSGQGHGDATRHN